jgi:hypothetical protein
MALTRKEKEKLNRIAELQKALKCTEEEAIDIYNTDYAIDHNERTPYDLPPEKEKMVLKEYCSAGYRRTSEERWKNREKPQIQNVQIEEPTKKVPTVYKFETKTNRPKNEVKVGIIAELIEDFLKDNEHFGFSNIEIITEGKKVQFNVGDDVFTLDLVQKRKPKA